MTTARHSFAELMSAMSARAPAPEPRAPAPERRAATPDRRTTENPRIAAGLTPEQWDKKRRAERRAEWHSRAASREGTITGKPVRALAKFVSFEDHKIASLRAESVLDKRVRLEIQPPARPEWGPSAISYFSRKWKQNGGTLGQYETLNSLYEILREGAASDN